MKAPHTMRIAFILVTIVGIIVASVSVALAVGNPSRAHWGTKTTTRLQGHGGWAHASDPEAVASEPGQRFRDILQRDAIPEAVASELGLSVTALQAARQDGTLRELLVEHGVTRQFLWDVVRHTVSHLLTDATAAGTPIPDEANDFATWKRGRRGWGHGHGHHGAIDSARRQRLETVLDPDVLWGQVAVKLDIAVDELQTAQANGTLQNLLAAHEITHRTWKESLQSTLDQLIADAVAAGTLTQDEADRLLPDTKGTHRQRRYHGFWFQHSEHRRGGVAGSGT